MAKKQTANLPVAFDAELAKQAMAYRAAEAASVTGNFISMRGGVLQYKGAPIEGNKFSCVILASVFENDWYKDAFDPDNPTAPNCYAFATTLDGLKPHAEAGDPQGDANHLCAACWANGWGSGVDARGKATRGKACQNRRRLAVIPVDKNFDAESAQAAEIAYVRIPVMSCPGYSLHVTNIADMLKLPPYGVVTEVSIVPDAKSQFRVLFKAGAKIERSVLGALFQRAAEAAKAITFPYPKLTGEATKPAKRTAKKAAAPKRKPAASPRAAAGAPPARKF